MVKMGSQIALWDFRSNAEGLDHEVIVKALREVAKHFVFQEEKGDGGYLHYQGRFSLKKKRRKPELMTLWTQLELEMPLPNYLEPTSNPAYRTTDFCYVTKADTRTRGPWDDKNTVQKYIPRQYRGLLDKLYPWQKRVLESATEFDDRTINYVYCRHGNVGKSTIASICELYGKGIDLPPVNDSKELIQACCDICMATEIRDPSPVFVDLPRAMDKNKLYGIYTAIEQIKKGKLVDTRYSYKSWWIDSPQVWVFSNRMPDTRMLSADRWKLWKVNRDYDLEPITADDVDTCPSGDE
ncbi:MAG: replication protein [Cressdnaviricota sp.]|nr:MAG: replication protein [Cressdnaviricota sp.]